MAFVMVPPEWGLPERRVTAENAFLNRRLFLRQIGLATGGWLATAPVRAATDDAKPGAIATLAGKYPAKRHPDFNPGWRLTNERVAGSYNNFYEFSLDKAAVSRLA